MRWSPSEQAVGPHQMLLPLRSSSGSAVTSRNSCRMTGVCAKGGRGKLGAKSGHAWACLLRLPAARYELQQQPA